MRPRVAGRDRLGYRRRGAPATQAELLGKAMGVPVFVVLPAHRRRNLRQLAARRRLFPRRTRRRRLPRGTS